ncbi:MAG: BMC domain-containing protein [Oscillospiraceae bacterium]
MAKSVGMIEFSSIAKGIETCDLMLKAAQVKILRASTICPGKYVVIIGGDTGDVKASMDIGAAHAKQDLVDSLLIPNVDKQVIPAISMTNEIMETGAVGVIEFYSVASAILAADTAVKAANIRLIEIKTGFAIGGKGVVLLTGDVGAVEAAVDAACLNADLLMGRAVIPRPTSKLFETLL